MGKTLLSLLSKPAPIVAEFLLGSLLIRELNGEKLIGKIVETEAYTDDDAASHSFNGYTPRNSIMFGPAGFAYVYFTYGMHYCMNVVTDLPGKGSAVLIRALEPIQGQEIMAVNRNKQMDLTNGPARLCQALAINKEFYGHDLSKSPLRLEIKLPLDTLEIVKTSRVGITREISKPWRFYIRDNPFVSKR